MCRECKSGNRIVIGIKESRIKDDSFWHAAGANDQVIFSQFMDRFLPNLGIIPAAAAGNYQTLRILT